MTAFRPVPLKPLVSLEALEALDIRVASSTESPVGERSGTEEKGEACRLSPAQSALRAQ